MEITFLKAVILGCVEGLTEFLPVSSTGHLLLVSRLILFEGPPGKVFEIVIQLGSILAICWLYRHRFFVVTRDFHRLASARHFVYCLVLAFIPAAVLGVAFHDYIKEVLFSPHIVSVSLILGGVMILIIERLPLRPIFFAIEHIPLQKALVIGCIQALALIPGVSRSGATIMGSLMLGVERKTAAEFSFFLAVPTMIGATVWDLYKNWHLLTEHAVLILLVGFFTAFVSAILVVRWIMHFISNHGFTPFAWYRITVGIAMLYIFS